MFQLWRCANAGLDHRQRYLLLRKAYDNRRMYNHPMIVSDEYARIHGFFDLISRVRGVPGDIVECGVGRGISLACLVYAVSFGRLDKAVYSFDSFSGFPAASVHDLGSRVVEAGKSPSGWEETSPEMIAAIFQDDRNSARSLLRQHDVRLEIVPGFFSETLPDRLPPSIALLHVDCDLYDSIKVVLERCLPRMSEGGMVVFDEYDDPRWPGAKKAADEVLAASPLPIHYFESIRRYGVMIQSKWRQAQV